MGVVERDRGVVGERPERVELRVDERRPAVVVQRQHPEGLAEDAQRVA